MDCFATHPSFILLFGDHQKGLASGGEMGVLFGLRGWRVSHRIFGWQQDARQIEFPFEGFLAQRAVECFKLGEALLVAGFDAFDLFDNGDEWFLNVLPIRSYMACSAE